MAKLNAELSGAIYDWPDREVGYVVSDYIATPVARVASGIRNGFSTGSEVVPSMIGNSGLMLAYTSSQLASLAAENCKCSGSGI